MDENFSIGVIRRFEISNLAGFDTIVAGTCVLTPVESKAWSPVPGGPPSNINPDHVLRDLVRMGKYLFTKDNLVSYSEMLPDIMEG